MGTCSACGVGIERGHAYCSVCGNSIHPPGVQGWLASAERGLPTLPQFAALPPIPQSPLHHPFCVFHMERGAGWCGARQTPSDLVATLHFPSNPKMPVVPIGVFTQPPAKTTAPPTYRRTVGLNLTDEILHDYDLCWRSAQLAANMQGSALLRGDAAARESLTVPAPWGTTEESEAEFNVVYSAVRIPPGQTLGVQAVITLRGEDMMETGRYVFTESINVGSTTVYRVGMYGWHRDFRYFASEDEALTFLEAAIPHLAIIAYATAFPATRQAFVPTITAQECIDMFVPTLREVFLTAPQVAVFQRRFPPRKTGGLAALFRRKS